MPFIGAAYLLIGFTGFISIYYILNSLPKKRKRWRRYQVREAFWISKYADILVRILWISKKSDDIEFYQQLLNGCGFKHHILNYFLLKRIAALSCVLLGFAGYFLLKHAAAVVNPIYSMSLLSITILGLILCSFDHVLLESVRKKRSSRITREIYVLSNQLLYYSGSKMNLHSKLIRCIPYTESIRNDLHLLINEWYEEAELAIRQFKYRLGTDEGYSFAETLNSLRLNDSEHYYDLLRQRIQDYKEKIELHKESKKEASSYILFILAGIPILNTFRVFIYPWVQEGQKLFDSLN
jgi:hypothetical protein